MLPLGANWDELVRDFRWSVPADFNMAEATVERHAGSGRTALIYDPGSDPVQEWSFGDLSRDSNRLANALDGLGVGRGDRVAIFLTQRPEVVLAHVAAWKLGAVSMPLTTAFGPQALAQRLGSGAPRVMICEAVSVPLLTEVFASLDQPPALLVVDAAGALPPGRPRVHRRTRGGQRAPRHRPDSVRRPGVPVLHQRHDRSGQGRAARAPRAARPHPRHPGLARPVPRRRRPLLDAR